VCPEGFLARKGVKKMREIHAL